MNTFSKVITRFAPSPTGFLHIGHLSSIIFSNNFSKKSNGTMVLRIEDIDFSRCKKEYKTNIINDLRDILSDNFYSLTDVSDYYLTIRLSGQKSIEVLSKAFEKNTSIESSASKYPLLGFC